MYTRVMKGELHLARHLYKTSPFANFCFLDDGHPLLGPVNDETLLVDHVGESPMSRVDTHAEVSGFAILLMSRKPV